MAITGGPLLFAVLSKDRCSSAPESLFSSRVVVVLFDTVKILGSPPRGIALETRLPSRIGNQQAPEPGQRVISLYEHMRAQHPHWNNRKPACGIYNCFGHIWASRRTAIYDDEEIRKILSDDGYRTLRAGEDPQQGDLALYLDSGGGFLHVGRIVEVRGIVSNGNTSDAKIPFVLSKWSDCFGEDVHHCNDHIFDEVLDKTVFYTDRP